MNKLNNKSVDIKITKGVALAFGFFIFFSFSCTQNPTDKTTEDEKLPDVELTYSESGNFGVITLNSSNYGWKLIFENINVKSKNKGVLPSLFIDNVNENLYLNNFGESLIKVEVRSGSIISSLELPNLPKLIDRAPVNYRQFDSLIVGNVHREWFVFSQKLSFIRHINPIIEYEELRKAQAIFGDTLIDVVGASAMPKSMLSKDSYFLSDLEIRSARDSIYIHAIYTHPICKDTTVVYPISYNTLIL